MRWQGRRQSSNVEDRRARGGGGGGGKFIGGGLGLVLLIVLTLLGGDPAKILNNSQILTPEDQTPYVESQEEKELAEFVSVVLADTEDVWTEIFNEYGRTYEEPTLVLFSGSVRSACGLAGSATGPFYCPADRKLYIDLSFYNELVHEFDAPGDFAMAYVVAHEVGHHVQNLLGTSQEVQNLRGKVSEKEYNQYSKRLELQADFYAGVWAHYEDNMNLLDKGDIEEALNAASAVGDDRIQEKARGYAVPDSFTHGRSDQRVRWFYKGFTTGDMRQGNTFEVSEKDL